MLKIFRLFSHSNATFFSKSTNDLNLDFPWKKLTLSEMQRFDFFLVTRSALTHGNSNLKKKLFTCVAKSGHMKLVFSLKLLLYSVIEWASWGLTVWLTSLLHKSVLPSHIERAIVISITKKVVESHFYNIKNSSCLTKRTQFNVITVLFQAIT